MGKKFKNKDLAAKLGVSGTLVSLVLNNKADQHGIKKETQEKVFLLARQMGYFDLLAEKNEVAPVEQKPGILGMIVPSLNDPFVMGITPFIQKALSDIGVGFSVVTKDPDDQRFDRMVSAFKKFFSGLILVGEAADDNTVRALRSTDYPFILLDKTFKNLRLNTVSTDTTTGSRLVVNHIQKLGYKNAVIVADNQSVHLNRPEIDDIINISDQNGKVIKFQVIEIDATGSGNSFDFEQLDQYLRPPFRADVLIVLRAALVYPIMAVLKERKLRVPHDIAIISMEEGPGFDLMESPVTCLRKPLSGMANKAVNMIWSEVRNSGKGKFKRQVTMAPELIIRHSCGTL
jgi:LacI family transcriptional regulator